MTPAFGGWAEVWFLAPSAALLFSVWALAPLGAQVLARGVVFIDLAVAHTASLTSSTLSAAETAGAASRATPGGAPGAPDGAGAGTAGATAEPGAGAAGTAGDHHPPARTAASKPAASPTPMGAAQARRRRSATGSPGGDRVCACRPGTLPRCRSASARRSASSTKDMAVSAPESGAARRQPPRG